MVSLFLNEIKVMINNPIETIKNSLFRLNAFIHYKRKGGKKLNPPDGYKRVFYDDFSDKLNKDEWRLGQAWGNFHPYDLDQHYDTEGKETYISKGHELVLELRHRPLDVIKSDLPDWRQNPDLPDEFTIPYAVGLVSTKQHWQWGWFSAEIKLPRGKSLWPAFWLSGENSWPPEIDIFEAYSKNTEDYTTRFLFKKRPNCKIQPNLHWGVVEDDTKEMWGAYDVPVYNATERFVQYACHWTKDFIKIYYDGVKVFETKDKRVLNWFNRDGASQVMILNNGVDDTTIPSESAMVVKNISVYQK